MQMIYFVSPSKYTFQTTKKSHEPKLEKTAQSRH